MGTREEQPPPPIPVVLRPRDRLHSMWHPSDQCEMCCSIQQTIISEATPDIRRNLRVPDERPVPPPLALDVFGGFRALVPSEESVQQPQTLGVLSVSRAPESYALVWCGWRFKPMDILLDSSHGLTRLADSRWYGRLFMSFNGWASAK